jgi:apolipoprotein N-acyltransferase
MHKRRGGEEGQPSSPVACYEGAAGLGDGTPQMLWLSTTAAEAHLVPTGALLAATWLLVLAEAHLVPLGAQLAATEPLVPAGAHLVSEEEE